MRSAAAGLGLKEAILRAQRAMQLKINGASLGRLVWRGALFDNSVLLSQKKLVNLKAEQKEKNDLKGALEECAPSSSSL